MFTVARRGCPTRDQAEQAPHRWLVHCADASVPELHRPARTLDSWRENCSPTSTPAVSVTDRPQAMNLLIKEDHAHRARIPQLRNCRLRLLLHCGVRLAHSTTNTDQRRSSGARSLGGAMAAPCSCRSARGRLCPDDVNPATPEGVALRG